jgi:hypothetical protein
MPLALFGASEYAVLMGRLALPSLLAQAISPLLGAAMLESAGAGEILFVLFGVAVANVVLVTVLTLFSHSTGIRTPVHVPLCEPH